MKIAICALLIGLAACGPSSTEFEKLKDENKSLKVEIEQLKNGASRLLGKAKADIEGEKYAQALAALKALKERHPESTEYKSASAMIGIAEKGLAEAAEQVKRDAAQKAAQAKRDAAQKAAQAKQAEEEKKRLLASATKRMKTSVDKLEGITWYKDAGTPVSSTNVHLYFGKKASGPPWLRFRIFYKAKDWLFIRSYFVVADGKRIEGPLVNFESDYGSGSIWEWADDGVNANQYQMVQTIMNSKSATIRLTGDKYYRDHEISAAEKQRMKNVMAAYEASGGTKP